MAAAKSEARTEAAAVTEQIVICSRGLTGLPELARGSVSHHVATHARRPMLIVPPPAAGA
jgi:nucleotide-binding universal stress UspA family protein